MTSDIFLPFISYSDISPMDTFIPSIIPEPDHHLLDDLGYLPTFYPTHLTITHDLTSLSIRRRRASVLDHFVCAFIHLLDFRFNIFHDGRAWQIADLLVMMLSFWQLARWVLIFVCPLHFEHWSSLFYSSVSLVLSAWCHDARSCLALPIWGWTFSLHDGWAYFRVQ